MAKSDAAGFLRQLEQTRRLLGAVKAGRARVEAEARAHIAAVRSERDAELKCSPPSSRRRSTRTTGKRVLMRLLCLGVLAACRLFRQTGGRAGG